MWIIQVASVLINRFYCTSILFGLYSVIITTYIQFEHLAVLLEYVHPCQPQQQGTANISKDNFVNSWLWMKGN